MKLQYVSDLHVEFLDKKDTKKLATSIMNAVPDASVLVLAGDIGNFSSDSLSTFLDTIEPRYDKILYVFGNHEYYARSHSTTSTKEDLLAFCETYSNLEVLDNRYIELNGKLIGGTTLWFDTCHPDALLNMRKLNDFQRIAGGWGYIREQELAAELFIKNLLLDRVDLDLLITHHGVTPKVHSKWEGSKVNIFFYKDIQDSLRYLNIPYVIHGHQHTNHDYAIRCERYELTQVLMNAKGYPHEQNNDFSVFKCIDL